jgi:hypothetical protein
MKILFADFNAKVSWEDIFKPTIGNESLHESSKKQTKKQTPWPESESELYRPSDRRLSAK